jgi:hypothetical protein
MKGRHRSRTIEDILAEAAERAAAGKLREAAETIEGHPMAMQMRFLQTLSDVGSANNTTIVLPIPMELAATFLNSSRHV